MIKNYGILVFFFRESKEKMLSKVVNAFGDTIITYEGNQILPTIHDEDRDKSFVYKTLGGEALEPIPLDFTLIYKDKVPSDHGDGDAVTKGTMTCIYANSVARLKCPSIQKDGRVRGIALVVMVSTSKDESSPDKVLMLKVREKHYLMNIGRYSTVDEDPLDTSIRSASTETGLTLDRSSIVGPFCKTWFDATLYDHQFRALTLWYYTHLRISDSTVLESLLQFHSDEIEEVQLTSWDNLPEGNHHGDLALIARSHYRLGLMTYSNLDFQLC